MKKRIYRYTRFWLALLLLVYVFFSFLFAPQFLKQLLYEQSKQQLNMTLKLDDLTFNPFTFNLNLHQFSLTDDQQNQWLQAKSLALDFDPWQLLWGQWQISDIYLEQPQVVVAIDAAGQFATPSLPQFKTDVAAEPLNLVIHSIHLKQGKMHLKAANINDDFELNIKQIDVTQAGFKLTDQAQKFKLKITTELGEVLALDGSYNHNTGHILSQITAQGWQASSIDRTLPADLELQLTAGRIDANGTIDWLIDDSPKIKIDAVEYHDLGLSWGQYVTATALHGTAANIVIDNKDQTVSVAEVSSDQAKWRLNSELLTPEPMADPEPTADSESKTTNDAPNWRYSIDNSRLNNWSVIWRDQAIQQDLEFTVLGLQLTDFSDQASNSQVNAEIEINGAGRLNLIGSLNLQPLDFNGQVKLDQWQLATWSPWLKPYLGLNAVAGTLSADQKLGLANGVFNANGSILIEQAELTDNGHETAVAVAQLSISSIVLNSNSKTIILDQIILSNAHGNLSTLDSKQVVITNSSDNQASTTQAEQQRNQPWKIILAPATATDK